MEETLQERQSDELEALKAIFFHECKDCNEGIETWKPLNVVITISPQKGSNLIPEVYVQVDLHVIATEEYPEKDPKIMLENTKGLSDKQLNEIQSKLEHLASSLKGEVMVFELVQYVQSIVTDCNNKPGFESFYEEMLSRQEEKKQKEVELKMAEENIQRQLIDLKVKELKKKRKRNKKTVELDDKDAPVINNKKLESKQSILKNLATKNVGNLNQENGRQLVQIIGTHKNHTAASNQLGVLVPLPNDNSRISREFEISDFIGRGAYGDVLKVKNKLDDCLYAIKRIHLNAKNRQLNRKIMREVKLLSRLNHENVVRYYNSWLEESLDYENASIENDPIAEDVKENQAVAGNKSKKTNNVQLPPQKENLSFSFPRPNLDPSFSDNDDDDEDCDWIGFASNSSKTQTDSTDSVGYEKNVPNQTVNDTVVNQFLYIQMEYCEKSTLRNAIDNNLYLDEKRVWRLLREIVEGLAYIHQQGIMHRDLKPVNIFIDSEDRVKIGDFGLATPNKHTVAVKNEMILSEKSDQHKNDFQPGMSDTSHTGQIGTALYVSPELNNSGLSVLYNQKVDIYSLGVIFFEMCYRPLNTEMERIKVLSNLRQYSRNLPTDFLKPEYDRQIKLIRDLLNHNPKERPSAQEILQNKEYIPADDLGDAEFIDTIRHALSNPQSKTYKHLISECFNQKVCAAENIVFDDMSYGKSIWYHSIIEKISQLIREIFHLHGGTYLSTPLLMPDSKNFTANEYGGNVSLMTKSGSLVNMPYDLQMPFARYLAQNPLIIHLKRYAVDKVYRERRVFGSHPREVFECSFDIVSSLPYNLSVEAELLSIVHECLQKFPSINSKNYLIRLNHTSLVTGILLHCRVKNEKHAAVCDWLNRNEFQVGSNFEKSVISENVLSKVASLMDTEIPLNAFSDYLEDITKRQTSASNHCKHGLHQLQMLARLLGHLDIRCSIVIAPSLIANIHNYSGIMFQVVWNKKDRKNHNERDVIAAGGRYDPLITKYRETLNINKETTQTAAGVVIFIDRLTTVFQTNLDLVSTIDVLVCSVGECDMIEEKLKIIKNLWAAGIRSTILNSKQSLEDTQSYCKEINIPHIIFVKEAEIGIARVRSLLKDRFCEKKIPVTDLVDYLQKTIKTVSSFQNGSVCNNNVGCINGGTGSNTSNVTGVSNAANYGNQGSPHHYGRSDSKTGSSMINVIFLTEEKYTVSNKRRYENQILNTISNAVQKISPKSKIDVLALNVEGEFVKQLIVHIDLNSKTDLTPLFKQFPRYKKDLKRISDYLDKLQSKDNPLPIVIVYSLSDSIFKMII